MSWIRYFVCAWLSWLYNDVLAHSPSRRLRRLFLRHWLGFLGSGTGVQMHCRFLHAPGISLSDRSVINYGCLLDGRSYPIRVGSDVSIGPEAAILTLGHDPRSPGFADRGGPVTIGNHVWIGYRAIILPGVSIGEGAVIAAGAVVSRDVPPFTIVAGNPSRSIGNRPQPMNYLLDYQPFLI
jgi:maltose O-acetyltransferase